MSGIGQRLAPLTIPIVVLSLLLIGGVAAGIVGLAPAVSHPSAAPLPAVTVDGGLEIGTPTTYTDTALDVEGSVTIESGGSLTLQNVQLSIDESSNMQYGIVVEKGGALVSSGSAFASAASGDQISFTAQAGSNLSITGGSIEDVGSASSSYGLTVDSAYATFDGVTFSNFYEALIVSAKDVTVEDCTFEDSTSTAESTWVISTSGSSAGFVMTGSKVVTPSMIGGALDLTSASDIENNTFTLDPKGTNPTPILIGYSGTSGFTNASGTKFSYNSVSGSDVTDFDSSNVLISYNKIVNTGGAEYVHDYGVRAETFNPSSGIWVNHLTVEGNWISNSTSFGVRVEQNVENALIEFNTITNISTDPQAGEYNGVQTYIGIYLIRGVEHSTVYDNVVNEAADQERSTIETAGVGLESEVDYCTVADNTILNTDLGIWVQGDWDDGPGNIGPSLYNTVTGNTIQNTLPIVQTANLASAIQNYDWANYTTISDNLIEGWNLVPSGFGGYEGEAIQQADDYGTIYGNIIASADYGIVFGFLWGNGASNGSYNVAYDNTFNISGPAIADDTALNPGPIVNEVNVLTDKSTSAGVPTVDEVAIGTASSVGFSEANGEYSATLGAVDPATDRVENVTSSLPWSDPDFAVSVDGDLGSGTLPAQVTFLNSTEVKYTVPSAGPLTHIVSLNVGSTAYTANYTVKVVHGSTTDTFPWFSESGPAEFSTTASGTLTVTVSLVNWTAKPVVTSLDLQLQVVSSNGTPESGVTVSISLNEPSGPVSLTLGPTNETGLAAVEALPVGTNVTNVTVEGTEFVVGGFSVGTDELGVIQLSVVVLPSPGSVRIAESPVDFTAQGLDAGAEWLVSVTGPESLNLTSSGSTITFLLVNGTYEFTIFSTSPSNATPESGTFAVPHSGPILVNFSITFPSPPAATPPASVISWASSDLVWEIIALVGAAVAGAEVVMVVQARTGRHSRGRGSVPARSKGTRVRVPLGRR